MPTTMNPLRIRARLDRKLWGPPEEFGPDGWRYRSYGLLAEAETGEYPADAPYDLVGEILVSCAEHDDGVEWLHASIVRPWMPTYKDLTMLHKAVFGDGYAYQVFAPADQHISIHDRALHLWGRLDGKPVLPEFGKHYGTI